MTDLFRGIAKQEHKARHTHISTTQLTTQLLAAYIGGQIEIQNGGEGYLYRGEIKTAEVTSDDELAITLNWMAKGEGIEADGNRLPTGWINDRDQLNYTASLQIYSVSNMGRSREGGDDRICLTSTIIGETAVIFPPNGSKLDPAKVRDLELSAVA
jgi:hypothetical protein